MNEKLKVVEKALIEERAINLGKQCANEYIIYNFYNITKDNSVVKRMSKEHYSDSTLTNCKKTSKETMLNKPLREVIDSIVYELLLKGYELLTIDKDGTLVTERK